MPVYNGSAHIAEAIESVINQTYNNWELIIVNDQSTDNTLTVAEAYKSEKIKIYSKENGGAAAARNYGYRLAKGSLIKFFDADDILNKDMITAQANLAIKNPESIISGKWGRFYEDDLTTLKLNPEECWKDMNAVDWICSSWKDAKSMTQSGIFLIPKSTIEQAGLWDESLSLIDDLEYFTKTILASKSIIFSSESILHYRSGNKNSLASQNNRKAAESCYKSMSLGISYLLAKTQNREAQLCAANLWQSFIFEYYGIYNDLIKKAEKQLRTLPTPTLKYQTTPKTKWLIIFFGWKALAILKAKINV
jgi:glycosyltransferase involved in cell wall biosynthesis